MLNDKASKINKYVIILIFVFITCSILSNFFFFKTFENIKINGPLYNEIKSSQELKADILPPKLYISESYLLIHQVISERNDVKVQKILEKIEKSKQEYFKHYEYWKKNINQKSISDVLLVESHENVVDFFKIYDTQFLPLLKKKDYDGLQKIVNGEMNTLFDFHRNKIDSASILIGASNNNIEYSASVGTQRSELILAFVFIFTSVFVIAISLVFLSKIKRIEEKIVISNRETELANNILENTITDLKRFKHNYDNALATTKGFILRGDLEGLDSFLDEIIIEKNRWEMKNYDSLDMLKNSGLLGIVLNKLKYSERFKIDFKMTIDNEVNESGIKVSHLSEILGILLDNAIEAAAESTKKFINFTIIDNEDMLSLEILNSTNLIPDKTRMFENGWTTKGENRGSGLWIVRDIISKYDNVMLNTFIEGGTVRQELMITK